MKALGQDNLIVGLSLLALAYFVLSFILIFFNASLYACVIQRLQGNEASLGMGMAQSLKNWQSIPVSSTIGLYLSIVEDQTIPSILGLVFFEAPQALPLR